jgi:hypothetical protein
MDEQAVTAWLAVVAVASEPADGDAVTHGETVDAVAYFSNGAGDFVPGCQRPCHVRKLTVDELAIGSADAAGLYRDAGMPGWWRGRLDVDQPERIARSVNVNGAM